MVAALTCARSTFPSVGRYRADEDPALIVVKTWSAGEYGPDRRPRGILQINHGMTEHIDRYDHFAKTIAARGWLVVGMDFIGHGDSAPEPDQLGHAGVALPRGRNIFVEDMGELRRLTQQQWPDVPYVMFGHSMGSFVLRAYLAERAAGLAGAILCGTGTQPQALLQGVRGVLGRLERARLVDHRSALFDRLTVGANNKPFEVRGQARTPFEWLNRDAAQVDLYMADPRCGFSFTLSADFALMDAFAKAESKAAYRGLPPGLPILLVSGSDDPVGGQGRGPRQVAAAYRAAGVGRVHLKLYPGARHEILHELNRDEVEGDIADWLDERAV